MYTQFSDSCKVSQLMRSRARAEPLAWLLVKYSLLFYTASLASCVGPNHHLWIQSSFWHKANWPLIRLTPKLSFICSNYNQAKRLLRMTFNRELWRTNLVPLSLGQSECTSTRTQIIGRAPASPIMHFSSLEVTQTKIDFFIYPPSLFLGFPFSPKAFN